MIDQSLSVTTNRDHQFLTGGGEMGERMRTKKWESTTLGPVDDWPQSLRTVTSVCLNSQFPILLWWGSEMNMIYNDAYRPILGESKHPMALGARGRDVWKEVWDVIGPMLEGVLHEGRSTWSQNQLLLLNRYGYAEECYFTFSYSPIYDESGSVGGIFCAVTETTEEVISSRHLNMMRRLSSLLVHNQDERDIYNNTLLAIKENDRDFPFAALYAIEGTDATLVGKTHSDIDKRVAPSVLNANAPYFGLASLSEAFMEPMILKNAVGKLKLPTGGWNAAISDIILIPVPSNGSDKPFSFLIAGMNPHKVFDEKYKSFFVLFSDQVSNAIANTRSFLAEKKRVESLQELDRLKTMFFSNVSHELRTPLTLMLGPIEALLNDVSVELPSGHRHGIDMAHRNAMRLLRLVNALLDFSRIEAGRVSAKYQPAVLQSITADVASNFRAIIEDAGLYFDVNTEADMAPVYVDAEMWEKILLNLISNAFKYTMTGGIKLLLRSSEKGAVLTVTDTGVGIPVAELPRMFERFHRIKNSDGRTIEGTGIGLSLVKELVKLHGGSVSVESEEGKGSTFTVIIPFGKDHLPAEQITESQQISLSNLSEIYINEIRSTTDPTIQSDNEQLDLFRHKQESDTKDATVLIVDDNKDMREYIERILSLEYKVCSAANGNQALLTLDNCKPDLIISDVMMPQMNGIELLHEIKSNAETANIPVMLLSARAGEEAKVEGLDTGADDYLVKPFAAKELIARVKSQIRISRIRRHAEDQLRNAFNLAPVATAILLGEQLVVFQANELMLELWGKKAEEVMNKPLFKGIPEAADQGFEAHLENVLRRGERFLTKEHPANLMRNGVLTQTILNFVYEPFYNGEGKIVGVVIVANDVTDLVRARNLAERNADILEEEVGKRTVALAESNKELRRTNGELEQFAYISSHDLQEPLRKIQTFTELVHKNLSDENSVQRYLGKIDAAATRMSNLIKSVLSYSRISKPTSKEIIDLNKILEDVLEDFEILMIEKKAQLHSDPLPSIPGDPLQLHQLFANLISNSLKFTTDIPVIHIHSENIAPGDSSNAAAGSKQAFVKLTFKDNGIGFDEKHNEKVFNMFQRLNNRDEYEGTGIGLALCKRIVEYHGGNISVASKVGEGSMFTVILPSR